MKLTPADAARLFDVTPEPNGLVVSFQKCLKDFVPLRARREEPPAFCSPIYAVSVAMIGATEVTASH